VRYHYAYEPSDLLREAISLSTCKTSLDGLIRGAEARLMIVGSEGVDSAFEKADIGPVGEYRAHRVLHPL